MSTQDWALTGGMPPELWGDAEAIKRKQAISELLVQQGLKPLAAPEVKGRFQGSISPFQGAAQAMQLYMGNKGMTGVDEARKSLAERYQTGLADAVSKYATTKAGTPGKTSVADTSAEGTGSFDMSGAAGPEVTTTGAIPGDPRKAIIEAMTSPYAPLQRMAQMDVTQLNRQEDRRDQQTFSAEQARLQREQRTADLQARLLDASIGREERAAAQKELAAMQIAARRDLATLASGLRQLPTPIAVIGEDGKPVLVDPRNAVGKQPWNKKEDVAKLPTPALKLQQEEVDAIGIASSINADVGSLRKQIEEGKLQLGPVKNIIGQGRNALGMSDENSRNLASFKASIEKLRNDSLRLNKGVQTEGDAIRAMNELIANINDPGVVKKRLDEIQKINERAVNLRKNNIELIRRNFGVPSLDTEAVTGLPAAVGDAAPYSGPERRATGDDPLGLRKK